MKRLIKSIVTISAMGILVFGATQAFFSDTETSTGNTFTAGSIDLSLGSRFASASNGSGAFNIVSNNNGRVLYSFDDLKPGDFGQGVFDVQVTSNEAYLCAQSILDSTPENGIVDPEVDAGDVTGGANGGELQDYLQIAIFYDANGNGVWDSGEPFNRNESLGDGNGFTVQEVADLGWISAADTTTPNTWLTQGSILANTPYSAGFMYCFGNFTANGVCSGQGVDANDAQTDRIVGGIEFYAVQTRNNDGFVCGDMNEEVLPEATVESATTWSAVDSAGKKWFAKARNNNSNFELAIGTNDGAPAGQDTAEATWVGGDTESFTLSYDGTGNATLMIDGETPVTFAVGIDSYSRIGINVKAADGVTTTVDDLVLSVASPLATDMISTTGSGGNSVESLTLSGVDLGQAWTLTGTFTFSVVGSGNQEYPAVQFSID